MEGWGRSSGCGRTLEAELTLLKSRAQNAGAWGDGAQNVGTGWTGSRICERREELRISKPSGAGFKLLERGGGAQNVLTAGVKRQSPLGLGVVGGAWGGAKNSQG